MMSLQVRQGSWFEGIQIKILTELRPTVTGMAFERVTQPTRIVEETLIFMTRNLSLKEQ